MNINPNTDDAKQQAQAVMHKFTSNLLEENMEQWISLFDDNAVFEFPYAPKHFVQVLQGKAAIYEYIKEFPSILRIQHFSSPTIHTTTDPGLFVAEFTSEAQAVSTGKPYNQTYISVIKLKNGKITHYKDYWNPLVALEALGS
ncbi:nuclear transport factor 2 family protein [Paenibacillus sp. AK121]|uniref:nuclear transport factor 2 family protein n=1 Tax=Paenibacillus TaxID=44249 RepID=UPI001C231F9E|nr:nuclear transport factor 2 family protein [Paenibacillus sp. AK121]MBU9709551.1 nuclear transport factor 2 family protein [Paenibacillus sp. AK121]MEE4570379.1 nuclear transport factor 2 family protein [Paenibacillus polymyxa]